MVCSVWSIDMIYWNGCGVNMCLMSFIVVNDIVWYGEYGCIYEVYETLSKGWDTTKRSFNMFCVLRIMNQPTIKKGLRNMYMRCSFFTGLNGKNKRTNKS